MKERNSIFTLLNNVGIFHKTYFIFPRQLKTKSNKTKKQVIKLKVIHVSFRQN